jgi:hypothetical protein
MKITEADLPETRYIQEGYFGAEIEPVKILETEFGRIYVGKLKDTFVFYDETGSGASRFIFYRYRRIRSSSRSK